MRALSAYFPLETQWLNLPLEELIILIGPGKLMDFILAFSNHDVTYGNGNSFPLVRHT
jgi:hypothetical protein